MAQLIAGLTLLFLWVVGFVGYISNILYIFKLESFTINGETILATIGVFLPPIGIIHGIYTWF